MSLLSVVCKVLTKVFAKRISATLDHSQPKEQARLGKAKKDVPYSHIRAGNTEVREVY